MRVDRNRRRCAPIGPAVYPAVMIPKQVAALTEIRTSFSVNP